MRICSAVHRTRRLLAGHDHVGQVLARAQQLRLSPPAHDCLDQALEAVGPPRVRMEGAREPLAR
eukprot:7134217-Prymnesium_polylepis.1